MLANPANTAENFRLPFTRMYRWDLPEYNTNLRGALGYKLIILITEGYVIPLPSNLNEESQRYRSFSRWSKWDLEYQSGLTHCPRS